MATLIRTDASNQDFQELVKMLDIDLQLRDGDEHYFYAQFNSTEDIRHVVVAYEGATAIGCGAIKQYSDDTMEIKRMFVKEGHRGRGIASQILVEIEEWTKELGFLRCLLETGMNQPEAINLYRKNLYHEVPNFGQYKDVENSICFEKVFVGG